MGWTPSPHCPSPSLTPSPSATAPANCSTGPSSQALSPLPAALLLPQSLRPQALSSVPSSLPCRLISIPTALSSPTLTPAFSLTSQPPISPLQFITHMAPELTNPAHNPPMAPQCLPSSPQSSGVALKMLDDLVPTPPGSPVHSSKHPKVPSSPDLGCFPSTPDRPALWPLLRLGLLPSKLSFPFCL